MFCDSNLKMQLSKSVKQNSRLGTRCEIALRQMSHNSTTEMPTLVQVMAWCRQAASHYHFVSSDLWITAADLVFIGICVSDLIASWGVRLRFDTVRSSSSPVRIYRKQYLRKGPLVFVVSKIIFKTQIYHDVDEICWPQPIRSLKLGHVTGQGSMSLTWVGRVWPRKNSLHKKCKKWIILLYILLHFF